MSVFVVLLLVTALVASLVYAFVPNTPRWVIAVAVIGLIVVYSLGASKMLPG